MKYTKEGRGAFGVAIVNGKGIKCIPWNYSETMVQSIPKWREALKAEMNDKKLKGLIPTPTGNDNCWCYKGEYGYEARAKNPIYKEKFGDDRWKLEVEKAISGTKSNVKDLIDHINAESKRIYEGTAEVDTFLIYHDHLSIMWEKEAISYMKSIGWFDRFIMIRGLNNPKVAKYYRNSVVGDSPELARGLDSYGFSDLEVSIKFQ